MQEANRWVLILAAGAGTRLQGLTADERGQFVPKQFCSLNGGPSLLEETIQRARALTSTERILVVVAAEHRAHWHRSEMPPVNVIVQPANRGTANGILLGATAILERDPHALLALLPSDHYVEQKHILNEALQRTLLGMEARAESTAINFLGIEPDEPDPGLGYIVRSGRRTAGSYRIARFIEKPRRELARALLQQRALWNSFILVTRAHALVALIAQRFPTIVAAFREALHLDVAQSPHALQQLYECLPTVDFSRGVVEGTDQPLRVVAVPRCGWSDLGTPERVGGCLERFPHRQETQQSPHLNLAEAYMRRRKTSDASAHSASA